MSTSSSVRQYPASHGQRALWFLHQLGSRSGTYNVMSTWRIRASVDVAALDAAWTAALERHESLRTTYRETGGQLVAQVEPVLDRLALVDATDWTEEKLLRHVADEAHRPFDLEHGPVTRFMLFTTAPDDHVLLFAAHHIAIDGWSNRIGMRELGLLYEAQLARRSPLLGPGGESCERFARWQAAFVEGPDGERLLSYWRGQLAHAPILELPTDRPRTSVRRHEGASETVAVDADLAAALRRLAQTHGTTLFVVLLAAFQVLLARYTGQDDVVVGSVAHGRTLSRFRRTIGSLMNHIALRADLSGEPRFVEHVVRMREVVRSALAHQAYPFPLLVERLAPGRERGGSAFFDVTFGLTYLVGEGGEELHWGPLTLSAVAAPRLTSEHDLDVQVVESSAGVVAVFQYDTDLFDAATITRMAGHYRTLLAAFAADPDLRVWDAPLLAAGEATEMLVEWNRTDVDRGPAVTVHELVEARVDQAPESLAVSCAGMHLTYRRLDERANQLAHRLRNLGVVRGTPVGVHMERSLDLPVALLSVLKAGGTCVPLDPSLPEARLASILADVGARVLITDASDHASACDDRLAVLSLRRDRGGLDHEPAGRLADDDTAAADDPAYILYAVGQSGDPRGVEVLHRAIVNVAMDVGERLALGPHATWAAIAPTASDRGWIEIWSALAAGARLEVVPPHEASDGHRLANALGASNATVLFATPTTWRSLVEAWWPGQTGLTMLNGGEPLTRDLADALLRRGDMLVNTYGPTEAAGYATAERVGRGDESISIGRATSNVRLSVLDRRGVPVPIGVPGELWIAGMQVSRRYVNRPDETARAFHVDSEAATGRRYRTGVLVRYRPDGRLEYMGRDEEHVRVRGHRVDVDHIAAALEAHPAVHGAAVRAADDAAGRRGLAARVVVRSGRARPTVEELRAFLAARLPGHMIPDEFTAVDGLPVDSAAPVDRRILAASIGTPLERGMPVVAARTGLEETLVGIWCGVLHQADIGVHDDFFDLGGHSLLATQVISRIEQTLHVRLLVRDLFERPTVADLADLIAARIAEGGAAPGTAIERRTERGPAPLSFSQERMWFLHQLAPDSTAYNVSVAMRLRGPLHVETLAAALREVVRRHEILRSVFAVMDGQPVQRVTDRQPALAVVEVHDGTLAAREARTRALCREEARRPFDLTTGPVFRPTLLRLGPADHVLLLTLHHIVCDVWSFGVLGRELFGIYAAYTSREASPFPPLRAQFADFAAWQRRWLSGAVLDAQLNFWRRHLGGTLPMLDLPTDRPRPAIPSYEGGWQTRRLSPDVVAAIKDVCREEQASVFMALTAGFTALLARYSGEDAILFGMPIANRNQLASEELIGDLVNTLPIRAELSGDPSLRELLRRMKQTLLDAYAHQEMPFDKLVQELQPARYSTYSPIIQVMVNLLNAPMPGRHFTGVTWEMFEFDRGTAQFDLTLTVDWDREGWFSLEYSSDLFERETAERIVDQFERLLRSAVAEPDRPLSQVDLLDAAEAEQLLVRWNETAMPVDAESSIQQLFERQVDATPDDVAITDVTGTVTYAELDRHANQLAHRLRSLGVDDETVVGVCLDRSSQYIVALLSVLKAGGAFLPLDPGYPAERLAFMIQDSGSPVLITERRHAPSSVPAGVHVLYLDEEANAIMCERADRPAARSGGDRLAYVIYTSGSTDTPKGVLAPHRGAVNRFRWMWRTYPFRAGEVCCQKTSTSFVDSIWEIFGPLLQGVPLVVIPDATVRDPRRFIQTLAERRVTRIVVVPSLLRAMLDAVPDLGGRLPCLSVWISSGETLSPGLATRFQRAVPHGLLLNLYGASEVAADSTAHEVLDADAVERIPIGKPIDNTQIYILDRRSRPVPVGMPGELYVGGDGLAKGYLNRPELTAQRFVAHPFSRRVGDRLYRTGDRARYRRDGTIEYLGRLDSQVKVRGFRVELGEVESTLVAHPDVESAVVVVRDDPAAAALIGYVVANNDVSPSDILAFARQRLPGYMVPSAIVCLDALPLTPSGKVDRRALRPPPSAAEPTSVPPRTTTEAVLASIWTSVLGVTTIGVHDDFFQLGGHSLLAAQLMARIDEVFQTRLPLRTLFEAPTIARFAALIDAPPRADLQARWTRAGDRLEIEL